MQSINDNIKKIDAVLWTHAHADHANGIDDLRQFLWTRKEQLPVYGSKDTINALKTTSLSIVSNAGSCTDEHGFICTDCGHSGHSVERL